MVKSHFARDRFFDAYGREKIDEDMLRIIAACVELLIPSCTDYIKGLWEQSAAVHGAKYLGIEVREEAVLGDVKRLIEIRTKTK